MNSRSIKFLIVVSAVLLFWQAILQIASYLGLSLVVPWGWLNSGVSAFLLAWYIIDLIFPRRTIYSVFGRIEGAINHEVRLWRRLTILCCGTLVTITADEFLLDKRLLAIVLSKDVHPAL